MFNFLFLLFVVIVKNKDISTHISPDLHRVRIVNITVFHSTSCPTGRSSRAITGMELASPVVTMLSSGMPPVGTV